MQKAVHSNSTLSSWDFITLLKPRVMLVCVFTAFCGMLMSPNFEWAIGLLSLLAIAIGAGAAGLLNIWWDSDIDSKMKRTKNRASVRKVFLLEDLLTYGVFLTFLSFALLLLIANLFSAILLLFIIVYYLLVYTIGLKRYSTQAITVGGLAGALPPILGYSVFSTDFSWYPVASFLVIFFWTPPHSWAMCYLSLEDYKLVNIPVLPLVSRIATIVQTYFYAGLLFLSTLIPYFMGDMSFSASLILVCIVSFYCYTLYRFNRSVNVEYPQFRQQVLLSFITSVYVVPAVLIIYVFSSLGVL